MFSTFSAPWYSNCSGVLSQHVLLEKWIHLIYIYKSSIYIFIYIYMYKCQLLMDFLKSPVSLLSPVCLEDL